jgi:hypothetical protein
MCIDDDDIDENNNDSDVTNENIDGIGFADPGGTSSLRAATVDNPRMYPCPTCGAKNRLTPIDVARGYQCDNCAETVELCPPYYGY